jgi:predicted nucleic acid-binding protein
MVNEIVYLDVCCFKRPFDDQRSTRIQLETAAIAALIAQAERDAIRLVRSPAHVLENDRNPREDRRLAAAIWMDAARVVVELSEKTAGRSGELTRLGFGALDALHVAFAEEAGARWLVTTDDRLIALGLKHRGALGAEIVSPIRMLEVLPGGER